MKQKQINKSIKLLIKQVRHIIKEAGGEAAGSKQLVKIKLNDARKYAQSKGIDLEKDIPDFDENFKIAQAKAGTGRTQRKDMPVIDDGDVRQFQKRLKTGRIDVQKPLSPTTDEENPFPNGLGGFEAQDFLQRGLKDGSKNDDLVSVTIKHKQVSALKPIQKQIYYDKAIDACAKFGVQSSKSFIQSKTFFITSADDFIIDGHHRFLSGMLMDPKMKVNCLSIDLPINKLLPLSTAYGDAIGNARNA